MDMKRRVNVTGLLPDVLSDFRGKNLSGANLIQAPLAYADLRGADLRNANLLYANLCFADLRGAELAGASLLCTDLRGADMRGANLTGADLQEAQMKGANLTGADLADAKLTNADLTSVKGIPSYVEEALRVVPLTGAFEGFKKALRSDTNKACIVHLHIPAEARRSNATSRKCRAEFVDVLEILDVPNDVYAYTKDYKGTGYYPGHRVFADGWDDNRWNECSNGIHFFLTKEEAEKWDI